MMRVLSQSTRQETLHRVTSSVYVRLPGRSEGCTVSNNVPVHRSQHALELLRQAAVGSPALGNVSIFEALWAGILGKRTIRKKVAEGWSSKAELLCLLLSCTEESFTLRLSVIVSYPRPSEISGIFR
jgi:hypothetical protein